MNNGQGNQSVKDILEDIKKAISGKNTSNDKIEKEDDDILYLEEEYLENSEEDSGTNKEKDNDNHNGKMAFKSDQFNIHSHDLKEEKDVHLHNNIQMSNNKVSSSDLQVQNNGHLILKENMEEIKELLEKMKNELQHEQQKKATLTVEELITSLLKPQLSEWLNKYLHTLVKEVVEKELKDIINNK